MPPKDLKAGIIKCLSNISSYAPEAAAYRTSDVVQKYIELAEKTAINGNDPSLYINAAKEFIIDCPDARKKEHNAELSKIMPSYYAILGDVKSCIEELVNVRSNPESGVPKEDVDKIYNYANMHHALNKAELEEDPNRRDVWLKEAEYYAPTWNDKLHIHVAKQLRLF